jgi:hypothetical protein
LVEEFTIDQTIPIQRLQERFEHIERYGTKVMTLILELPRPVAEAAFTVLFTTWYPTLSDALFTSYDIHVYSEAEERFAIMFDKLLKTWIDLEGYTVEQILRIFHYVNMVQDNHSIVLARYICNSFGND